MYYIGPHACEEAIEQAKLNILRITPTAWERNVKLRILAKHNNIVVHREPAASLERRCGSQNHQGIIGEGIGINVTEFSYLIERIKKQGSKTLILALDSIMDPNNFGAILRSAAGAGVDGVLFPERRSVQINETVIRASAGTAGRIPLVRVVNLSRAISELKKAGAWVYGLSHSNNSIDYLQEKFTSPTVLVLGSEGFGLHEKIQKNCDKLLSISMPGGIESLNVASTAAIIMFRVLAQRQIDSK